MDFGISRLMDDEDQLTRSHWVLGSPGYLSPEQARGALEEVGPHSDVFALGAIVYRMVTGQNAFQARDIAGAVFEAVHAVPPAPSTIRPELPEAVDLVMALALAKSVKHRYRRATELARDLCRAAEGTLPGEIVGRARAVAAKESTERTLSQMTAV
jgi:serine/threonine-protein kinase